MRIFIEDSFDAAHWLPNVPDGHKCRALHGHTYRVRLEVSGEVGQSTGWVIDYSELKFKWDVLKGILDHHCLNDIFGLHNPTCEHVALWISEKLKPEVPGLFRIEIRETEKCGVVLDC